MERMIISPTVPAEWRLAALAAVEHMIARIIWDEARGVAILPGERDCEPDAIFYSVQDLREYLLGLAHGVWAELVGLDEDGWPTEEPDVEPILREALAAHEGVLACMGWLTRRGD